MVQTGSQDAGRNDRDMITSRLASLLCLLLAAAALGGCATSSLFIPYPARAADYKQAVASGNFAPALKDLDGRRHSEDKLLFLLERGRLNQLAGNTDASLADFGDAISAFQAIDDRALVSASHTLAQGTAMISNDNSIPYQGAPYERIFLHQYQALNYIARGDMQGALVEVRRANTQQEKARDAHQALLDDARQNADKKQVAVDPSHYQKYFAPLDDAANHVRDGFQNAYTFYTSALLYEAAGKFDDAYIDYKRALAVYPDNPFAQQDVLRLAKQLKRSDDVTALAGRVPLLPPAPADYGTVVVFYEEGFAPPKQAVTIPFPWPYVWFTVSFPVYNQPWSAGVPLLIRNGAQNLSSAPIVDVQALASRELKDNIFPMLVRQTLRAYTKHELQQRVEQQSGGLLGFFVAAYNIVSEQADLRSWLTLPHSAQLARLMLPEGQDVLTLQAGVTQTAVTVPVQRGRITLLRVTSAGGRLYTAAYPL
jgi:hypothetical protein